MIANKDHLEDLFKRQQEFSHELKNTTARERQEKLAKIEKVILARKEEISRALFMDFSKPVAETLISEVMAVLTEIRHTSKNLKSWMKPSYVKAPLTFKGTRSRVEYEPKGTVLIIAPFNYPFSLAIGPLVSAIAAGNTAIIKPSEFTMHTSDIIESIVGEIFEEEEVAVIKGEVETAKTLLNLPFNHIFFTGSPAVGKLVMKAAAEHLAEVTLELGGKSPAIIDETADIKETAKRIVWGKCINGGQTCVAPDYVFIARNKRDAFTQAWKEAVAEMYGEKPQESVDLAAIVNTKHFERINNLIDDAKMQGATIHSSGNPNIEKRKIAPTLITDVPKTAKVLEEEIFGPVLPVLTYGALDEAIQFIRNKPKPLALYIYSKNSKQANWIISQTSAGTTAVNHNVLQFSHPHLPFGGVNNSGIGKAHGEYGFKAFSNERAVLEYTSPVNLLKIMFPPYDTKIDKILNWMTKWA